MREKNEALARMSSSPNAARKEETDGPGPCPYGVRKHSKQPSAKIADAFCWGDAEEGSHVVGQGFHVRLSRRPESV